MKRLALSALVLLPAALGTAGAAFAAPAATQSPPAATTGSTAQNTQQNTQQQPTPHKAMTSHKHGRTHATAHKQGKAPAEMKKVSANALREGNRETKALNILSANGYVGVTDFRREGKSYLADVDHNGKRVAVTVDPMTGKITQQS